MTTPPPATGISPGVQPGWLHARAAEFVATVTGEARAETVAGELERRWSERQRAWHGPGHLFDLLGKCEASPEREVLGVAAIWHDAIYDPTRADNEERSADLLREHAGNPDRPLIRRAVEIITASKWQELPTDPLVRAFFEFDTFQLSPACALAERARYERAIFQEYQFAPLAEYRKKRTQFLEGWAARFPEHRAGVAECLQLLASASPRLAVYPGSFNPFHRGHLSVLRQAEHSFDKVLIAVGINRQKPGAELAQKMAERFANLRQQLPFHEVAPFEGLLTDFLEQSEDPLTVVRGVRDGTDLEAELRFARILQDLRPVTMVVWIGCDANLQHVSSSACRELESIQPGASARYVPEAKEIYGLCE